MPEFMARMRTPRLPSAPTSPVVGEMYFNTATGVLSWWNGTSWLPATGGNVDYLGDYSAATTYNAGDYVVGADGTTYQCVRNGTLNQTPVAWGAIPGGGGTVPSGCGMDWYTPTAPTGFLLCDGSAISRTTYATLFAVLGVIWGAGDGSTTFNLPDTRGRVLVGFATAGGHADVATFAANDGTALANRRVKHGHTNGVTAINSVTASHNLSLPDHWHNISDPGHSHSAYTSDGTGGAGYVSQTMNGGGSADSFGTSLNGTGIGVRSPQTFPAINGGVAIGGSVGIGGTIGVTGGPTDGPSYVVANKVIKT